MKCCSHKIFLFDTHVYKFIRPYNNLTYRLELNLEQRKYVVGINLIGRLQLTAELLSQILTKLLDR